MFYLYAFSFLTTENLAEQEKGENCKWTYDRAQIDVFNLIKKLQLLAYTWSKIQRA